MLTNIAASSHDDQQKICLHLPGLPGWLEYHRSLFKLIQEGFVDDWPGLYCCVRLKPFQWTVCWRLQLFGRLPVTNK
jgi:hypothetical protein